MEVWSLSNMTDRYFRDRLTEDPSSIFGKVELQFSNGSLRVSKRMAYLNLYWFPILAEFGIPLRKDHFIRSQALSKEVLTDEWNRYYDEIMDSNPKNAKKLKLAIWKTIQDLYTFCSEEILEYTPSLDLLDMARLMESPEMKEISATKDKIVPAMGSRAIEQYIEVQNKNIMNLLASDKMKDHPIYPYSNTRQLNKFQVPQTLYAFGMRTDVSDNIVGYPVVGNAMSGLKNIMEFAGESLSAKKSAFYNKVAVADSQYFNRKQHLITSSLQHVYDGDCGSKLYAAFNVTEDNYKNTVGKYIRTDAGEIVLTKKNIKSYIGTTIHMRTPGGCVYRLGVCERCGGAIFNNLNRKMNIGIVSAIRVMSKVTQKILSSKHLVKTNSLIYELTKQTSSVLFSSNTNELRWMPGIYEKSDRYSLGISVKDFTGLHDVLLIRNDRQVKEERFSSVKTIHIRDNKREKIVEYQLENNKQVPFLSSEMLQHVRDNYQQLEVNDKIIWIPVAGTEKIPLFRTIVVNDNMLQFVNAVNRFLSNTIKTYTSYNLALQDLSELIYNQVDVNIAHLEVLLKAYMISSPSDYRIPRISDLDDVMFQTVSSVLNNRHIGTKLAYERLNKFLEHPNTYLIYKQASPFDVFTVA